MEKISDTKILILEAALDMATQLGLENVTIGALAKVTNMSKSGLFAHFQSKENLQLEILNYAAYSFSIEVVLPSLKVQAGVKRIEALVEYWMTWGNKFSGGCIFVTASSEYSDRPGKVRDLLTQLQNTWIETLCKIAASAIRSGDFRADIDEKQFAFDLYSSLLGYYLHHQLLHDSESKKRQQVALQRLLTNYM